MTISGFLPQRWRASPEAARHAEAIAGVLHTAPLEQATAGPGIVSLLGTTEVLPYLVALKSLHRSLRKARFTIVDDGTLTGEDRAILAHHCGDPEIVPHQAVRRGALPPGGAWAALLTVLDRRAGQYWIALDPRTVTLGELPEVAAAIASNRSFSLAAGEAPGGPARQAERRIAVLCGTRGWRYRAGCGGLSGLAAGGTGRALVTAFQFELAALGETATAESARNLIVANEAEPVWLPKPRYARHSAKGDAADAAFQYFPNGPGHGEAYTAASQAAISRLL
uniref:hypothetical protein n=1 Tax=Altererythrobacter segetis TaxID=1104773 RepID=UPI001407BF1B|nr:hypothetical protein [Altererythrobacter segetis]